MSLSPWNEYSDRRFPLRQTHTPSPVWGSQGDDWPAGEAGDFPLVWVKSGEHGLRSILGADREPERACGHTPIVPGLWVAGCYPPQTCCSPQLWGNSDTSPANLLLRILQLAGSKRRQLTGMDEESWGIWGRSTGGDWCWASPMRNPSWITGSRSHCSGSPRLHSEQCRGMHGEHWLVPFRRLSWHHDSTVFEPVKELKVSVSGSMCTHEGTLAGASSVGLVCQICGIPD